MPCFGTSRGRCLRRCTARIPGAREHRPPSRESRPARPRRRLYKGGQQDGLRSPTAGLPDTVPPSGCGHPARKHRRPRTMAASPPPAALRPGSLRSSGAATAPPTTGSPAGRRPPPRAAPRRAPPGAGPRRRPGPNGHRAPAGSGLTPFRGGASSSRAASPDLADRSGLPPGAALAAGKS